MAQQKVDLESLWKEAVYGYLSKTKQKSTAQEWTQPITTKADLDGLIKQYESDFAQFRSSHKGFYTTMSATMTQLQNIGGIAQAAVQLSPFAPTGVILQAGFGLVRASAAVSDTYDDLETLFTKVKDMTDRVDEYIKGTVDEKLQRVVVKFLGLLLNVFGEERAAIRRGRCREWMRHIVGKENKVQIALARVDALIEAEMALGIAIIHSTAQRVERKIDNERDRKLLRKALCAEVVADNEKFGKAIESSRFSQSGSWILEEELYKHWVAMRFPVLWILGGPGTGKTYLASRIISKIREKDRLVSYFYLRESMSTQHTLEVILKVISYQITKLQDAYRERMVKICSDDDSLSISGMTWEELFTKLLIKPFSDEAAKPVFVVIDGVDEATSASQGLIMKLAKILSDLRPTSCKHPALQLLLLGRPEPNSNIPDTWTEHQRPRTLLIEPYMSKPDIERFIMAGVSENIHLLQILPPKSSESLKMHIVDTISSKSGGMFLLAKLMLTEVENMNKPELIQEALTKLPKELNGMFQRVVTRLDSNGGFDKQDLNELIMWVACAKRDLLLGELDLILKLRDVSQNGIVGLEGELKTRFGSFFSVISTKTEEEQEDVDDSSAIGSKTHPGSPVDERGEKNDRIDRLSETGIGTHGIDEFEDAIPHNYLTATVKFSHASVGQYFRTAPLQMEIGMDLNWAQAHIALTCSQCLTYDLPRRKQGSWRRPGLFDYSASHVLDHVEEVNFQDLESRHPELYSCLTQAVVKLFTDRFSISGWVPKLTNMHNFIHQLFSQSICTRLQACMTGATSHPNESLMKSESDTQMTRDSLGSLLEPFAHYIVDAWVHLETCDGIVAIIFVQRFLRLRDPGDRREWDLPRNRPFEHIAQTISPERIRFMASLSGVERDAVFHSVLASTLARIRTPQHLRIAVEEFDYAIHLAQFPCLTWRVYRDRALVLSDLSVFEGAIEAASNALVYLSGDSDYDDDRRGLHRLISNSKLEMGDRKAAFKAAKEAWDFAPSDPEESMRFIWTAYRTRTLSETAQILRSALESSEGLDFLGQIIASMGIPRLPVQCIAIACEWTRELGLARDAFQAVCLQAHACGDLENMAIADAALAHFYFGFDREDEKAVALWEAMVRNYPSTDSVFYASFSLMPWYFTNAQMADSPKASIWISKMERLVDVVDSTIAPALTYPSRYEAAAVLARWYMSQGEMEKARTKIRPFISACVSDLTDQDDSNDFVAYLSLGRALLCVGDRRNAAISLAFTKPLHSAQELVEEKLPSFPKWNSTSVPSTGFNMTMVPSTNPFGDCDGFCSRNHADFKSWTMCEICIDVAFCDECYPKVKAGTTTFRICDPNHPHFEFYPPRGLVMKGPEGWRVQLEDREVSDDEWLEMIVDKWL